MIRYLLLSLLISFSSIAQQNKEYQGRLWKITGNGLDEPSYLYGTMHVSNRVAFHLSETFFDALESADVVALETNPEYWVEDLVSSPLYRDYYASGYTSSSASEPLYESFVPTEVQQQDWEYYLSRDQDMLNTLLYRVNMYEQEYAENTFLDLFIFQAGKKGGKKIVALEDYQESFRYVLRANRTDEDAVRITERQARDLLGDFPNWQMLMEDAYRRGDLDLLDEINTSLYPGRYYRKFMLDERNLIMVDGMDSLMQEGEVLFTGVGASHLPGDMGVINLLREMGYTVEAEAQSITTMSISRKDEIDEVIFTTDLQEFISDDDFISASVPGTMTKVIGNPFQEYVYADMANGGFYSIRRVSTFGALDGKPSNAYFGKIDSMLFENIPGKILLKDTIEVSGFTALDIRNETRQGDAQHYQIVFTPLEVIIIKVGGHKEFANSELPDAFFNSIQLGSPVESELYSPDFRGFEVNLPGSIRTEQYEGAFGNPNSTFWAQSYDDGDYYAVSLRQYYDFEYLEEDHFELEYLVEKMADEKEYDVDTIYVVSGDRSDYSRFELTNERDKKLYGEVHIQGPKYVMLITTAQEAEKREAYFSSFDFTQWHYEDEFEEYVDTVFNISMVTPKDFNSFSSLVQELSGFGYGYYDDEDRSHLGSTEEKNLSYPPTGEQIHISRRILPKYVSYDDLDSFWRSFLPTEDDDFSIDFIVLSDTITQTIVDDDYLSQVREVVLIDTNTTRVLKTKAILENGAMYSITVCSDTLGYNSKFIETAFRTFKPASDTIIGEPVTVNKSDLFFDALESRDSTNVYQATSSIGYVQFEDEDADKLKEIISDYTHEGFNRTVRVSLLSKLASLNTNQVEYLRDYYYQLMDSSAYQFGILTSLANLDTEEGVETFKELILDEPPFTSDAWAYSQLFFSFNDSMELAAALYPDILPLADFIDYRSGIYSTLGRLLDSGYVDTTAYLSKFETLLLFAKVELKKQHSSDDRSTRSYYSRTGNYNSNLYTYTKLLTPYSHLDEVQEHYRKLLTIRNRQVLARMLMLTDSYQEVPDSIWNFVAKDGKALYNIYPYLSENGNLDVLDDEYSSREAMAEAIMVNSQYSEYDTIAYIRSEFITVKGGDAEVFFFKAKNDGDQLWTLMYVMVDDLEEIDQDYLLAQRGETYDENQSDIEEIIDDVLDEVKLHDRKRVRNTNQYYGNFY